ncbi:MAG: TolC family protein [Oscillibacter sp.]|nr:TolC family protein [Oscillibacter sp.]
MNGKQMLALFLAVSVSVAALSVFAEEDAPPPEASDMPGKAISEPAPDMSGEIYVPDMSGEISPPDASGEIYAPDGEPVTEPETSGNPAPDEIGDIIPSSVPEPEPEPEATPEPSPEDLPEASTVAGSDDGGERPERKLTKAEQRDIEKRERIAGGALEQTKALSEITFEQVEGRAREDNMTVRAMRESLTGLENIDYEKSQDDILKALQGISAQEEMLGFAVGEPVAQGFAIASLESQYNSLYATFKDLRDGKTSRNSRDAIEQLDNAMNQVVMGAETLYIALIAMRDQHTALSRQLDSVNRTVEELELRFNLGQISALTLNQAKSGRTALLSGMQTLEMNMRTYKMQLENMLGASLTGEIVLGELPGVSEAQIAALDTERDFSTAHEKSYELYAAARTLQDARETFLASGEQYRYNESNTSYQMARHTWTAAQDTYNVTVRGYELKFRTLAEQVHDYYQVWNASKAALEAQKLEYQAKELQHKQGNISQNTLLTAKDALSEKEEAVRTAANNLFSSYNNYCWAVQTGILN